MIKVMVTLRAQAVDMIYRLPDNEVLTAINFLQGMLDKSSDYVHFDDVSAEKDAAFERLEKWRDVNKHFWDADFDWKQEVKNAINEKYHLAD